MNKRISYHYPSGTDKDGNKLFTFETRETGAKPVFVKEGVYADEAQTLANKVNKNPQRFGF